MELQNIFLVLSMLCVNLSQQFKIKRADQCYLSEIGRKNSGKRLLWNPGNKVPLLGFRKAHYHNPWMVYEYSYSNGFLRQVRINIAHPIDSKCRFLVKSRHSNKLELSNRKSCHSGLTPRSTFVLVRNKAMQVMLMHEQTELLVVEVGGSLLLQPTSNVQKAIPWDLKFNYEPTAYPWFHIIVTECFSNEKQTGTYNLKGIQFKSHEQHFWSKKYLLVIIALSINQRLKSRVLWDNERRREMVYILKRITG